MSKTSFHSLISLKQSLVFTLSVLHALERWNKTSTCSNEQSMTDDQKRESQNHVKNCLKDEKPIWRENMWAATGSFSLFSFLHRLLQRGKCYEEVKCGDLVKISLKLFKSQIAIDLWKYHLQIFKVPSKITPNSIWLENMICKSKSIT